MSSPPDDAPRRRPTAQSNEMGRVARLSMLFEQGGGVPVPVQLGTKSARGSGTSLQRSASVSANSIGSTGSVARTWQQKERTLQTNGTKEEPVSRNASIPGPAKPEKPAKPPQLKALDTSRKRDSVEVVREEQRTEDSYSNAVIPTLSIAERLSRLNLASVSPAAPSPSYRTSTYLPPEFSPSPTYSSPTWVAPEHITESPPSRRPPPPPPAHIRKEAAGAALAHRTGFGGVSPPSLVIDTGTDSEGTPTPTPTTHQTGLAPLPRHPSTSSISSDGSEGDEKMLKKRAHVLAEIRDSEAAYLNDLMLLDELFYGPAKSGALTSSDARTLFANLEAIIEVSRAVLGKLGIFPQPPAILDALIGPEGSQAAMIEGVYTEFCKRQASSLTRLAEMLDPSGGAEEARTFILAQTGKLKGRTTSWDLPSLLVKPVQRILKLPLLLKALVSATPASDPTFSGLELALERYTRIAESINEVKRRKEVTEKAARSDGPKNLSHWASKSIARAGRTVREKTGLAGSTIDATYEALCAAVQRKEAMVRSLKTEVSGWLASVKVAMESVEAFGSAEGEWELLGVERGDGRVREGAEKWAAGYRTAEKAIQSQILPALDKLLDLFRNPNLVIRKRDRKRLDFDRLRDLPPTTKPDESLEKSAAEYEALHRTLMEELPKFLVLVCKYLDVASRRLAGIQKDCLTSVGGEGAWTSWDGIRDGFKEVFRDVGGLFEGLQGAEPWRARIFGAAKGKGDGYLVARQDGGRASSFSSVSSAGTGSTGWASELPTTAPPMRESAMPFEAVCVFPYHGEDIQLIAGEVVTVEVSHEPGGWYWAATGDGREGWVEKHYLERM